MHLLKYYKTNSSKERKNTIKYLRTFYVDNSLAASAKKGVINVVYPPSLDATGMPVVECEKIASADVTEWASPWSLGKVDNCSEAPTYVGAKENIFRYHGLARGVFHFLFLRQLNLKAVKLLMEKLAHPLRHKKNPFLVRAVFPQECPPIKRRTELRAVCHPVRTHKWPGI